MMSRVVTLFYQGQLAASGGFRWSRSPWVIDTQPQPREGINKSRDRLPKNLVTCVCFPCFVPVSHSPVPAPSQGS